MKGLFVSSILLFLFIGCALGDYYEKIRSLPGLSVQPKFNQYSGYITVDSNGGRNNFFWFVESLSNPSTDPVVLWLTGGPGCSGLFALFTEHGPFTVTQEGNGLSMNPYSWNTFANMIYVEAPCGVGFSYATSNNYTTGDDQTAQDNLVFLKRFFTLFPQFQSNRFYIAGESYGGHYVPQLADALVSAKVSYINFKGYSVGNPSMDRTFDYNSYFPFIASHALVDKELYDKAYQVCQGVWYPSGNDQCTQLQQQITQQLGYLINPYNIYADCNGPQATGGCLTQDYFMSQGKPTSDSQTVIPCIDTTAVTTYLNNAQVRQALGIPQEAINVQWYPCSPNLNYIQFSSTVLPIYKKLLSTTDLKIIVYSGDVDTCVPYPGTEAAVDSLNLTQTAPWYPWLINNQDGGYVKNFGNLRYATVKGAGHMVPTYKPAAALHLFQRYLYDLPL